MADMLAMPDGNTEIIFDAEDFLSLVGERVGTDAERWLSAKLSEAREAWEYAGSLEKDMQAEREKFRGVIREIREQSETLAGLISQPEYDRKKISETAGRIGVVTWKYL